MRKIPELSVFLTRQEISDVLELVLKNCYIDGIYNCVVADSLLHVNLCRVIFKGIELTEEEENDCHLAYDNLNREGLIDQVKEHSQYQIIANFLNDLVRAYEERNSSLLYAIQKLPEIVEEMEKNVLAAKEMVDSFDKEKLTEVTNLRDALSTRG